MRPVRREMGEGGASDGLGGEVGGEVARLQVDGGQADAADGEAVADMELRDHFGCGNCQARGAGSRRD